MPHSSYFGPGYWATLQMLAAAPGEPMLEHLYVSSAALPGRNTPLPRDGCISIPDAPGMGFEPDWDVLDRFARR